MRQGGPESKQGDMALSQIKEKIAALEDEDTQANLTQLLKAYEDALAAEKAALETASSATQDALDTQKKAASDARSALAAALSEAGINILNARADGDQNNSRQKSDGNRGGRNGFSTQALDTEEIEKLIAGLNDADTQAGLTKLLEAYEDALTAEKTGMSNTALTEDEKKALRETAAAAADKLTDALTDAGVEQSDYTRRSNNTDGSAPEAPPEQGGDTSSAADSSGSGTAKTGILQRFINWLGSWIK